MCRFLLEYGVCIVVGERGSMNASLLSLPTHLLPETLSFSGIFTDVFQLIPYIYNPKNLHKTEPC
jgi:hypothetical protein